LAQKWLLDKMLTELQCNGWFIVICTVCLREPRRIFWPRASQAQSLNPALTVNHLYANTCVSSLGSLSQLNVTYYLYAPWWWAADL